ncbi:type III secretion system export apparatus subunit SctU [Luteimonas fraxinea]|uniref:Type III secretion system export apparatus subunit SctU n=1 Tax=Luteimonas fraxinea TaxID=2901869 RepID=A0ABS8UHJ0_9GAMM|nr:type III secretion system export apparatus subunit SctU [Luteimonas fraxinea]MCD9098976.1 type III secretion system export apparatus subunit SctU [Luteimonas fraxinea]MCD9127522.1 type III secretion system export apparatus subunit SctU [Luteimonas fraxinea]UHH08659.1 type III secretion system export apparatus subunit SctU [Luteimonas fraxinea]
MAEENEGADKTEKPTSKKLKDARKDANVAKSRELTSTVLIMGWLAGGWMLMGYMFRRISGLFDQSLNVMNQPFDVALHTIIPLAAQTFLAVTLPLLLLAVLLALLVEFLQVGPVLSMKKVTPDLSKMNPVSGVKKMFSMDNLVELIKSVLKSAALLTIGGFVLWGMLPSLLQLPFAQPAAIGSAIWHALKWIGIWTIFVFFFVSAVDASYQKYSYMKKLRMSRRDIKQEVKENEGDPYVKQRRKQLHQEWSQQNMLNAVRGSNVIVTNPTHIAVALQYEQGDDLPLVVAKGEGHVAEEIKRVAEEAGVPILENVPLARGLNARVEIDDYISDDFFEAVAQVLYWAEGVRMGEHRPEPPEFNPPPDMREEIGLGEPEALPPPLAEDLAVVERFEDPRDPMR